MMLLIGVLLFATSFARSATRDFLKPEDNIPIPINKTESIIFHDEEPLQMKETESHVILWKAYVTERVKRTDVRLDNEFASGIARRGETIHFLPEVMDVAGNGDAPPLHPIVVEGAINMTAKFIGYNQVFVTVIGNSGEVLAEGSLKIEVLLKAKKLVKIYQICLAVIMIIVYTNMGANLDLSLVKQIIIRPTGPIIGLFCQYVCMPLIAFGLGYVVFPNDQLFRLGLFASGSSPGGGLSNMWTHVLGGSLDLSIMMTFASTVIALGAVPMWLMTLGRVIVDTNYVIPFMEVFLGICFLILPCFAGIFIQIKFPKVTKIMKLFLTPLSFFNIIFIFSFGTYANFYLFSYLTWEAVAAGFGQSILGAIAGLLVAFVCRRNKQEIIAISIETLVQNNGVAFLLLKMSLKEPAGDLAVLVPGCVALFVPCLLVFALLIKILYERVYHRFCVLTKSDKKIIAGTEEMKERVKTKKERKEENTKDLERQKNRSQKPERATQDGIDNPALDLGEQNQS